jgi:hypothetical protein
MKFIKTGKNVKNARHLLAMVDDEDFDRLNKFSWQARKDKGIIGNISGDGKKTLMHRYIMKAKHNQEIDHIDGNRLNNQKSNLRFATSSQNKANRGPRKDNKSGYKGVSWHKQLNKWTVRIMINGKYLSLGLHNDILEAAKAYNKAALKYYGQFAWLNPV